MSGLFKLLPCVTLAALAGCPPGATTSVVAVTPIDPRCPVWGCGMNAATIGDGIVFDELDRRGLEPNSGGVKIIEAHAADGTPVKLGVARQELFADAVNGGRRYQGEQLHDLVIKLHHAPSNEVFELKIVTALIGQFSPNPKLTFWAEPREQVPAYDIKVRRQGANDFKESICKGDILAEDPMWAGVAHAALVFEWDRYDADAKTVSEPGPGDPWFQLACAGTAKAKIHLLRHTLAGSYDDAGTVVAPTDLMQRQTMLKMLTADYCGKGRSFTRDGTPLVYQDANHRYTPARALAGARLEAIWQDSGAVCLDTPRIHGRADIVATCDHPIPSCAGIAGWESQGYVISARP